MDWLSQRQAEIEQSIAAKHLCEGGLIIYDFTSTYEEGTTCTLAQYGYSRDKKKGKLPIIFGLLCNAAGDPIAVEFVEGNVNDAKILSLSLEKVRFIMAQAHRVRSHVFLCLLAYDVEWQMRQRLAPLLFEEEDWLEPFEPTEVVLPNKSQTPAKRKASTQRTSENFPVQSFRTLLTNLATITKNRVQPKLGRVSVSFDKLTIPNPLQHKAFDLLEVALTL
ncbi:hypothetical protein [Microcoleus sp. T3B2]